ncbi:hypothetical protein SAMN05216214_10210 [Atopomonas hussainii]|uniref:Ferric siderophore reductase C-terminal domain-containing protein n=1 Tax=Atopomonas hussainii TaxID=1429083 RepID=A0A1H7G8C6_9GAMM|nr:hypothetical protein [Atopomonas hussainii]SEK34543.1 hypothetical protein SAMN05216214_10210 [Atopomonas hussainii]
MNFTALYHQLLPNDAHVQEEIAELRDLPAPQRQEHWPTISASRDALWQASAPLRAQLGIDNATVLVSVLHKQYCQQTFARQALLSLLQQPALELGAQVGLCPAHKRWLWTYPQGSAVFSHAELIAWSQAQLKHSYPLWRQLGLGPGVFWSNAALSLVMPWNFILGHTAASEELGQISQAYLASFGEKISQQLQWIGVRRQGLRHWLPKREGCCLQYQCSNSEGQCGTCSLRSKDEFLTLIRAHYGPVEEDSSPAPLAFALG